MLKGRDENCTRCKLYQTAEFVCLLGEGDPHAEVMIIGEAPGKREDDSGTPFVGKSGRLLNRLLSDIGLDRADIFISNAVHCRPPNNRTPTAAEIRQCRHWVEYEIKRVKPKYILLLGNIALQSVLGVKGIRQLRGKPKEHNGAIVLPTYHPAAALRDERMIPVLERDFQKLAECIEFGGIPEERDLDYVIVDEFSKVEDMLSDLHGCVAGDLETTRLYPFTTLLDRLVSKGKATKEQIRQHKDFHNGKQPQVVSIQFATGRKQWILPAEEPGIFSKEQLIDIVDRITERLEDCYLVGHNWKFDALWMRVRFGVVWNADFDTMLAHYLCDENDRHGLKELAQKYLGAPDWDISKDTKTGWSLANAKYGAHDIYFTRKLRFFFRKWLDEDPEVKKVFEKLMMPYSRLFTEIEFDGVYIDQSKMDEAEEYLRGEVEDADRDLQKWMYPKWSVNKKGQPIPINWGSPQQLARLLYEDLGLPGIERTKSGKSWSTSESVLLRTDHPIAGAILKRRGADKQLSAFIEGWYPYIDLNGYLHPSFKLHGTVTGRPSCEHPNLQQVPRDKRIRQLVTALAEALGDLSWVHVEIDLSQIELRLAAELANEQNILQAFRSGADPHWITALREIERGAGYKDEVIDTAYRSCQKKMRYSDAIEHLLEIGAKLAEELLPEFDWPEKRKKAKAINFGYLFGMWWKKFKLYARDNYGIEVNDQEAQDSRKTFFNLYPGFVPWHNKQKRFARNHGYVRTLSGRKRRLPEAQARRDSPERREAERQAINSPVQGFAAELNLMAALQIRKEFPRNVVRLTGTVHDACLMRVRRSHVKQVCQRALEIMRHPELLDEFEIDLGVPLDAEVKIGPWGLGVSLSKWLKENELTSVA